jgi:hypothetical protein
MGALTGTRKRAPGTKNMGKMRVEAPPIAATQPFEQSQESEQEEAGAPLAFFGGMNDETPQQAESPASASTPSAKTPATKKPR